jgi:hypothetical protein
VVEKKSTMVKAMTFFVGAHVRDEMVTLSKKELLSRHAAEAEPVNGEALDPVVRDVADLTRKAPP